MHDELGEHDVEGAVREGERLDRAEAHVDARELPPGRLDERLGGVDGRDRPGAEAGHELCGEAAGAAADVEGGLARLQ